MEGTESEAIFESFNLNPQAFINEAFNTVGDLLDDACSFYLQESSNRLEIQSTVRSEKLKEGIASVRRRIQSILDVKLSMWEKYCLRHCFEVPKGFSLPKSQETPGENLRSLELMMRDNELDSQLEFMRDRIRSIRKESAELQKELQSLEIQSSSRNDCFAVIKEISELYEQSSAHDLFEEMVTTASELRRRVEKQRSQIMADAEGSGCTRMICEENGGFSTALLSKGLSNAKLNDLNVFLADLKKL